MKKITLLAFMVLSICMTMSCKRTKTSKADFPRDPQMARIQILNAFGATDAAIRAAAFNNAMIEDILLDRGSSSSGSSLRQMRGWSVQLSPSVNAEDRAKMMKYFDSLKESYNDLGTNKYPGYYDFDFSYTVTEKDNVIRIIAEGSYDIR